MAEGWLKSYARELGLRAEIHSAGTEKTRLKPEALRVMAERGIDLSGQRSKTLLELPDPWNFDLVLTVCDAAAQSCPAYPARTKRLHVSFPDPSGRGLDEWRRVRDALERCCALLARELAAGRLPSEDALKNAAAI